MKALVWHGKRDVRVEQVPDPVLREPYKAAQAGMTVVHVDPAYTSQGCSACGHVAKANRTDQATFRCRSCGFAEHADRNAARNIAARGITGWAAVSLPNAA